MYQPDTLKDYLSPSAKDDFDDIVLARKLGASANIVSIGNMLKDIAAHAAENGLSAGEMIDRVLAIAGYFDKLRGESTVAVTNAIKLMTGGLPALREAPLAEACKRVTDSCNRYGEKAREWMDNIVTYGYNLIKGCKGILVFDYSSSVDAIAKQAALNGQIMDIYIPESRVLDGGKPFAVTAVEMGHRVHFFPDVAIYHFLKKSDMAFIGVETFYPDGSAANTVGTDMLAILCKQARVPFYIPTTLIKVDMRGLQGIVKRDLAQDLSGLLAPHWDENLRAHTDFTCPDLSIIGPEYITGYITEVGIVPGTAMFGIAREYAAKLEKGEL